MPRSLYKVTPACYIFTHQYLNTMQQGIQTAHAIGEFIHQFEGNWDTLMGRELIEWSRDHKTIRILNAGSGEQFDLNRSIFASVSAEYKLASASFREPDINNMVTAFGFIMPPRIISEIDGFRQMHGLTSGIDIEDDHEIVQFLAAMSSAR